MGDAYLCGFILIFCCWDCLRCGRMRVFDLKKMDGSCVVDVDGWPTRKCWLLRRLWVIHPSHWITQLLQSCDGENGETWRRGFAILTIWWNYYGFLLLARKLLRNHDVGHQNSPGHWIGRIILRSLPTYSFDIRNSSLLPCFFFWWCANFWNTAHSFSERKNRHSTTVPVLN